MFYNFLLWRYFIPLTKFILGIFVAIVNGIAFLISISENLLLAYSKAIDFLKFIYSHVHTLFASFLPPASSPIHSPLPYSLLGRTCSALISDFAEEKT
jgi:hypothetical protein